MRDAIESEFVVFAIAGERYGIRIGAAERVLPMVAIAPLPQAPAVALGVINLHGEIVPVFDVCRRFDRPPREFGLGAKLLLANTERRRVALAVDEVIGPLALPVDAVIPSDVVLPGVGSIAGVAALPDGVLFIHDLETFLSLEEEQALAAALENW